MLCLLAATMMSATTSFINAPRLTVVISIDQFRRDYVGRFSDLFLQPNSREGVGGFRWLAERGAQFVNSAYTHVPTVTAPGHSIIGTGSNPSLTGIIGNEWYDRATGKVMYCVSDPDSKDILTGQPSSSPKNLRVSTFCDELERSTGGMSRTASVSFKDRAAILMAGRSADDVVWLDVKEGRWTTSDFYEKSGRLPEWASAINAEKRPDTFKGKSWTPSLSSDTLKRASIPEKPSMPDSFGKTFPHPIPDGESFYSNWQRTPWGNEFVLDSALSAIRALAMGKDNIPDLITINLSTNDFVGHWFGPDSPEVMDLTVATDKYLASFFRAIDHWVGLKNTMIVLTADHGVMPMPEEFTKNGQPGGRMDYARLVADLKNAVRDEFGDRAEILNTNSQAVYLKVEEGDEEGGDFDTVAMFVRDWLRKQPEVYAAFSKWEFEEQKLPETSVTKFAECSYFPGRSPDVTFFTRPGFMLSSSHSGTTHGSPWIYDRAVPLLMAGKWVQPGKHTDECGPKDIAATLCAIWGIMPPTGSVGRALRIRPN